MALAIGCAEPPAGEVADTVYRNGRIYTVDESRPWVDAVAIKHGKLVVVGSNGDVDAVTGESTEVRGLGGDFAMPGIGDSQSHLNVSHLPNRGLVRSAPTRCYPALSVGLFLGD